MQKGSVADIAYVSAERWNEADPEVNLHGVPELVVEVLSPSNSAAELNEKERLYLEHGATEFWVVDPDLRQVKVSTPMGEHSRGVPVNTSRCLFSARRRYR